MGIPGLTSLPKGEVVNSLSRFLRLRVCLVVDYATMLGPLLQPEDYDALRSLLELEARRGGNDKKTHAAVRDAVAYYLTCAATGSYPVQVFDEDSLSGRVLALLMLDKHGFEQHYNNLPGRPA